MSLDYRRGYPPTVNAYPDCVSYVQGCARKVVGEAQDAVRPVVTMGAEDFSFFLQQRPGCFFFVGAALPGEPKPHHKSVFDFDEDAMMVSGSVFLHIIQGLLCQ